MSIQYAGGTNVNTTFTCTVGTRREIVDGIVAALASAGWSYVSGEGTGDVLMQSALTPQNLQIHCRLYDPGSGNCAQITMKNVAGTRTSQVFFLLPAAAKVYRVIANKYQWFCVQPATTLAREFVAMGTIWVPSWLTPTNAAWINGNAQSDTDTTIRRSFGTSLSDGSQRSSTILNDNLVDHSTTGYDAGAPRFVGLTGGYTDALSPTKWSDDSSWLTDPLIGWGLPATSSECKVQGQLWDAVLYGLNVVRGTSYTFDGHNWYTMTHDAVGSTTELKGALILVVP